MDVGDRPLNSGATSRLTPSDPLNQLEEARRTHPKLPIPDRESSRIKIPGKFRHIPGPESCGIRGSFPRVRPFLPCSAGSFSALLTSCWASLAQLVEQRFCKPLVVGSSPTTGSISFFHPNQLSTSWKSPSEFTVVKPIPGGQIFPWPGFESVSPLYRSISPVYGGIVLRALRIPNGLDGPCC